MYWQKGLLKCSTKSSGVVEKKNLIFSISIYGGYVCGVLIIIHVVLKELFLTGTGPLRPRGL